MHRHQRGITLIECLISVVVFGVGMLAAAQCLLAGYNMVRLSTKIYLATLYAQYPIEQTVGNGGANGITAPQILTPVPDNHFPQNSCAVQISQVVQDSSDYMVWYNITTSLSEASWANPKPQTYTIQVSTGQPLWVEP